MVLMFTTAVAAQSPIELTADTPLNLKVDTIEAIDDFETVYYTIGTIFYKQPIEKVTLNYSNVQLGVPTTVNVFNPLKINIFYQDFNTAIILDNRLAEIFKVDFNTLQPYKNISHISTGYDNTLWLFNQDTQRLELYDYKKNNVKASTIPVESQVLGVLSDYNYCWLLTTNYLYQYSYFGSLISKLKNNGFTAFTLDNESVILKTNTGLYYKSKKAEILRPILLPKLLINQFLLTNETLYIYDSENLHKYQLKL